MYLKGPCHTSQFWVNYSSAHKQKNTLISKYFFNHGLTIHLPLMNFCENSDGNVVFLVGIAWKWLPINCIMGHGPFALIAVQSPNRWGSSGVWLLAWSICLWNLFTIQIKCSKNEMKHNWWSRTFCKQTFTNIQSIYCDCWCKVLSIGIGGKIIIFKGT